MKYVYSWSFSAIALCIILFCLSKGCSKNPKKSDSNDCTCNTRNSAKVKLWSRVDYSCGLHPKSITSTNRWIRIIWNHVFSLINHKWREREREREREIGVVVREREREARKHVLRTRFVWENFGVKEGENYGSLKGQHRLTDWKRRVVILSSHRPTTWKPFPMLLLLPPILLLPYLILSSFVQLSIFTPFFLLRTDLFRTEFVCSNLRNSCISVFYFRGQKSENPLKICPVITTLLFVKKKRSSSPSLLLSFFFKYKKKL